MPAVSPNPTSPHTIFADTDELRLFAETLFRNCVGTDGWISLRAFQHEGAGAAVVNRWTPFDMTLVPIAAEVATAVANRPYELRAVFSPPVCLFGDEGLSDGKRIASESNVVCAPAVAVELDERPAASLETLVAVLGRPTLVVASGGQWCDPTDVLELDAQARLHAYWRLVTPAASAPDRALLRQARALAARLVAADTSAVPLNHPMRWAGSWHTKGRSARLCRIVGGDRRCDIDLTWAVEVLGEALIAAGLDAGGAAAVERGARRGFKTRQEWSGDLLQRAARIIPNEGLPWDEWNRIGMVFFDASHASVEGLDAFHVWSEKDGRYTTDETDARWSHWHSSPPSHLSAGTLLFECRKADPNFMLPGKTPTDWFELQTLEAVDDAPDFVRRLNRSHAFVMNKGQSLVANMSPGGEVTFSKQKSFLDRYANETVILGKKEKSIAEWWWADPKRRQYLDGIDFDPDGVPANVFNLWTGFPLLVGGDAGEAGCALILRHIREVICDGDRAAADYLLGWLAHILQRPGEKPGVAVVLRGKKGCGKDTLGEILDRILRHLSIMISATKHFTSGFNAHMSGKLLLHVEEAIWAGSKPAESVLKSMITAPTMSVEPKGVDLFKTKNRMRILMTSNEDWVVPASEDERRYFVLNVSDRYLHDAKWFDPLRREIDGAGPACFAQFLRDMDLSGFDVRRPAGNVALTQQKLEALDPVERWLYVCLLQGSFDRSGVWPTRIAAGQVRDIFEESRRRERFPQPIDASKFGRVLFSIFPSLAKTRPRSEDGPREWLYVVPDLGRCRTEFQKWLGGEVQWKADSLSGREVAWTEADG